MQRAEAAGTDPDEELREVVGRAVLGGVLTGYQMSEPQAESDVVKRPRTDDGTL